MLTAFNDILSVGLPPDLFNQEDKDNAINAIRPEVKAAGLMDSTDACWDFFVAKVRRQLHIVLCMSPVGQAFRVRCRKFPALTNCTASTRRQPRTYETTQENINSQPYHIRILHSRGPLRAAKRHVHI